MGAKKSESRHSIQPMPMAYGPARQPSSVEFIERRIARHLAALDGTGRAQFLHSLRSAAGFAYKFAGDAQEEKDRKLAVGRVKTNARRLLDAINDLDEEATEFIAGCATGAAGEQPDRAVVLRGLGELSRLKQALESIRSSSDDLPHQSFNHRPEFLIAYDVRRALLDAGLPFTAADTGVAADCFRVVAELAQIEVAESVRYWLKKAIDRPEI